MLIFWGENQKVYFGTTEGVEFSQEVNFMSKVAISSLFSEKGKPQANQIIWGYFSGESAKLNVFLILVTCC